MASCQTTQARGCLGGAAVAGRSPPSGANCARALKQSLGVLQAPPPPLATWDGAELVPVSAEDLAMGFTEDVALESPSITAEVCADMEEHDEDVSVFDVKAAAYAAAGTRVVPVDARVMNVAPVACDTTATATATSQLHCSGASSAILSGGSTCSSLSTSFSGAICGMDGVSPFLDVSASPFDAAHCTPHAAPARGAATVALPHTAAAAPAVHSMLCAGVSSISACSSRRSLRDQNSVTIKATTVVKDAAGAIDKILSRGVTALVTALRSGPPPYGAPYDSLNQAVKAIAVARQYAKETGPEGAEVTFLPFHRYDATERPDPSRFAFLVFPVLRLGTPLKTADETVLNVARGSDVHKMAGAIIAVMLDRGQAVMKAAGSEAIFVAMSAVVNARHRLVAKHGFDLMLAASWITEDTLATMGRESKFLRFNILKCEPAGPKSDVPPALPAMEMC